MSECRRTLERLAAYTDKVLPPDQREQVERHLNACPPCRLSATDDEGGRTVLRACAERLRDTPFSAPLPPGLRSRCEALADSQARVAPPAGWRHRFVPVAMTAALILFTCVAVFSLATQRSSTLLAAQLTADHSNCFGESATDAPGLNAADVEEILAAQYGWDVHVPSSNDADGVRLVGARRCLYADGRVPHVLYRVNGEPVSLYMLEGVMRSDADVTAFGHRSRIWSRGPNSFVLVSPAGAGELAEMMAYVRQEAH